MNIGILYSGGIGNWILATPLLRAFELMGHQVDVLLWETGRESAIAELCWVKTYSIQDFTVSALKRRYSIIFGFRHPTNLPPQVEEQLSQAGNAKVYPLVRWQTSPQTESEYYMQAARLLGWEGPTPFPYVPMLEPPSSELVAPHIGFGIGGLSVGDWQKKLWPWEHWQRLAECFPAEELILAYGGETDRPMLEKLAASNRIESIEGQHLQVVAWLIKHQCKLFISNDTSTMHIAAAVGTPVIGLFGPTMLTKNRPFGPGRQSVITSSVACAPCYNTRLWKECEGGCMGRIAVEQVAQAARTFLGG